MKSTAFMASTNLRLDTDLWNLYTGLEHWKYDLDLKPLECNGKKLNWNVSNGL